MKKNVGYDKRTNTDKPVLRGHLFIPGKSGHIRQMTF